MLACFQTRPNAVRGVAVKWYFKMSLTLYDLNHFCPQFSRYSIRYAAIYAPTHRRGTHTKFFHDSFLF